MVYNLGVQLDNKLNWFAYIDMIRIKISKRLVMFTFTNIFC